MRADSRESKGENEAFVSSTSARAPIFSRLQVDHSPATKQLEGRKQDKERLTIVICCNEDVSEKIPLWIIAKYAKSRCFKNINMSSIDCQYRANKRAWMTSVLFDEYVRWLDRKMNGR
ncbi:hypothetical protein V6N13_138411 [Hibiscus sabdariffa]